MNRNSYVILTVLNCQRQYQAMSTLLIPNKLTEVEMPIIKNGKISPHHISKVTLSKRRHIHLTIYDALKNHKALRAPCEN